jgi:hypothetical protein
LGKKKEFSRDTYRSHNCCLPVKYCNEKNKKW